MKIIIEVLTESQNSIGEAIEMLQGLQNGPQSNGNVPTQPKVEATNTNTAPKEKKPSEPAKPAKKASTKKSTIDLQALKDAAKNAVGRSSREEVKAVISEYGEKLTDVVEADYEKLYLGLQKLGA